MMFRIACALLLIVSSQGLQDSCILDEAGECDSTTSSSSWEHDLCAIEQCTVSESWAHTLSNYLHCVKGGLEALQESIEWAFNTTAASDGSRLLWFGNDEPLNDIQTPDQYFNYLTRSAGKLPNFKFWHTGDHVKKPGEPVDMVTLSSYVNYDDFMQGIMKFYYLVMKEPNNSLKERFDKAVDSRPWYRQSLQYDPLFSRFMLQYVNEYRVWLNDNSTFSNEAYKWWTLAKPIEMKDKSGNPTGRYDDMYSFGVYGPEYNGWYGELLRDPSIRKTRPWLRTPEDLYDLDEVRFKYGHEWSSFQGWFARKNVDLDASHPLSYGVAEAEKPHGLFTFAADSTPDLHYSQGCETKNAKCVKGTFPIDENGWIGRDPMTHGTSPLITKNVIYFQIENLLFNLQQDKENGWIMEKFYNGRLAHAFLSTYDYHRYHFPAKGKIVYVGRQQDIPNFYLNVDGDGPDPDENTCYSNILQNPNSNVALETTIIPMKQATKFKRGSKAEQMALLKMKTEGRYKSINQIPKKYGSLEIEGKYTTGMYESKEYYSLDDFGYQLAQARAYVVIEIDDDVTTDGQKGYVAAMAMGMAQVSSCMLNDTVVVGNYVSHRDEMGWFELGASDFVYVFSHNINFQYSANVTLNFDWDSLGGKHHLMGELYGCAGAEGICRKPCPNTENTDPQFCRKH